MWPFRFAMQRRTKRGLPHMTIYLLTSGPKNGVELMDGVQSITRGWWRPTPGSIYPMLKDMTDQGLVRKREDGRYELTQKGRQQAHDAFGHHRREHRPQTTDDMLNQMESLVSYMEDLKKAAPNEIRLRAGALSDISKRVSDLVGDAKDDGAR